jgi:hypothetical protein
MYFGRASPSTSAFQISWTKIQYKVEINRLSEAVARIAVNHGLYLTGITMKIAVSYIFYVFSEF